MAQYELIIKNETSTGSDGEEPTNMAGMGEKPNKSISKPTMSMAKVVNLIGTSLTSSLVLSKVGEFSRDSLLQQQINTATSLAITGSAFAVNPALGTITLATSMISQSIDYDINARKELNRTLITGERAGYINRSR